MENEKNIEMSAENKSAFPKIKMKDLKFAITDSTTFEPQQINYLYSSALLDGVSIGYFKPILGVKYQEKLFNYNTGNFLKAAGCTWSASGEGTLDEKLVSVCALEFQMSLCVETFAANAYGQYLRKGSNNGEVIPVFFKDYMTNQIQKKISQDIETLAWQGGLNATYPNALCNGLIYKLSANTDTIKITAAAGTAFSTGGTAIFTELQKVYTGVPTTIKTSIITGDLKVFMSDDLYTYYQFALGVTSNEKSFVDPYKPNFLGLDLVWTPGLPARTMVAANASENLLLITDMMNDFEYLKFLEMSQLDATETVRIAGRFRVGFDFFNANEVVLYSPLV